MELINMHTSEEAIEMNLEPETLASDACYLTCGDGCFLTTSFYTAWNLGQYL